MLKAKAYKGLVRPQVEYCSSVWDPCPGDENNGFDQCVGRLQRRLSLWGSIENVKKILYCPKVTQSLRNINSDKQPIKRTENLVKLSKQSGLILFKNTFV